MQKRIGQIFTFILEWGQGTCKKSRPYLAQVYTTLVVLVNFIICVTVLLKKGPPLSTIEVSSSLTPKPVSKIGRDFFVSG